ncbi:FecR family protein, partial [Parabacteroides goldsteinii]
SQKRYSLIHKLARAAAILIIPLLSIAGSYLYIRYNTYDPELIQCFVPEGEKQELILPDGSKVNINSGSLLIYPKEFRGKTRTLFLTGEANFTVRKDKEHPFIVNTSYLKVEALGTKFNVQAYSESDKIITTLENGAVRVDKIEKDDNSFILSPNEQLEYNYKTGVFEKKIIDATSYSGWIKGELNFINQPLKEILATIQRKYAVDFVINPRLFTPDLYTIKFRQYESINTVMKILTMTVSGLSYEIEDNIITIQSQKKKGAK